MVERLGSLSSMSLGTPVPASKPSVISATDQGAAAAPALPRPEGDRYIPSRPTAPVAKPGAPVPQALKSSLHNHYKGARHQCFNYSWTVVKKSGGRPLTAAHASREGHNKPITHLNELIDQGQLRPGDVIYSSRRPGADPSSRNLVYGPHWFVYIGDRQFADQYGTRDAEAMQAFVPGRKIDTIYHPFDI